MQEETFRALDRGTTLIARSRRLARALTEAFHQRQRELGRSVWARPDILPLDAFLDRMWRAWLWRGPGDPGPALLGPLQEETLWEMVIRDSPAGDSLLQIPETARSARDAWALVRAYGLPVDGRFEASDDSAAFRGWARDFERRCARNRWMERARLPDFLSERIQAGEIAKPASVLSAGFSDLTPQQASLFAALGDPEGVEIPGFAAAIEHLRLADATDEIRHAAHWARGLLERDPETEIGIIVPNLSRLRSKVQRIFQATLDPSGVRDSERSFHVSVGPRFDEHPLVHAALLMLEFGLRGLPLARAGMLLRSPFLGGAEPEWSARALLDAKLRQKGVWQVSPRILRDAARNCPRLEESLRRFERVLEAISDERRPSAWAGHFSELLAALGWPGERALSRREYQVEQEWRGLLSDFATLDSVAAPMTFDAAFWRLRAAAASVVFQVENEGANVQIMGMFEASGVHFDHVWIMGLDEETLPAPANPNPFLPLALQQERALPHSSAERELTYAQDLLARLIEAAPDAVLSYPQQDGDRALGPTPLILGEWQSPAGVRTPVEEWVSEMRAGALFETLADEVAPPIDAGSIQGGGTYLFKDMAACPFRAFAIYRLGARPLEASTLGLSYRDHGTGVHKALELIWNELGSHARLIQMDPGDLRWLVSGSVAAAMAALPPGIGRKVEQRRLEKLLLAWLDIEKTRDPFVARKQEQQRLVSIGGLQLKTRADRIDVLEDGREIILDYKTGILKLSGWDTDRPDEPQLPLYCATSDRPAGGAAMVSIRTGELGFRGLTGDGIRLPEMKEMRISQRVSFGQQVVRWRQALEGLAENMLAGRAEVDPKEGACENCGLWALCRIREYENERG